MTKIFTETNPAFNLPVDTIYYIESANNTELNDFVQKNKADIEKLFAKSTLLDYKLVYIGRNHWQNAQLLNLLQLKFPEKTQADIKALQTSILANDEDNNKRFSIMKLIRQRFASNKKQNSDDCSNGINLMCRLLPSKGENDKYSFLTMDLETVTAKKLYENIADFLHELDLKNDDALIADSSHEPDLKNDDALPPQKEKSDDWSLLDEDNRVMYSLVSIKKHHPECETSKLLAPDMCENADAKFELEDTSADNNLREMAQKIRDEIAAMQRENGINILVEILGDDLLATLKKLQPATLSRIIVDENMNMLLPDYQNKEVKMNALSKTLYCLFLLHPKGIRIKDLSDYKSELLTIYKLISNRENLDTLTKSIDELCDPLSNSINEKLSRIRKAFCDIMVSDLAQEYIPDGPRGEAKHICLDPKLVILPQILKNIAK